MLNESKKKISEKKVGDGKELAIATSSKTEKSKYS